MTIVAAWIRAETGVGPSMASSSQACSGTWADLPQAASSSMKPSRVDQVDVIPEALAETSAKRTLPNWASMVKIAIVRPRSPMRFMMKALLPARAAAGRPNQKPISR